MRLRDVLALLFAASTLISGGCDITGRSDSSTTPGTGPGTTPGGGGKKVSPLVFSVEPDPLQLSPGDLVRFIGINFSSDLSKNRITFTAGTQRIAAIPVRVDFPTDGNPQNGLESEVTVVVPGGVSAGNVELAVDGVVAGARGYDARPQIMAWQLGRTGLQQVLVYFQPNLGFSDMASFVRLYGINFNDLTDVTCEDSQGGTQKILPNTIERTPVVQGGGQGSQVPTGYSSIGFNLRDTRNDVRLNFAATRRDNMKIRVLGPSGVSNTIEVPVISDQANTSRIGAILNGVKVPAGVRTGPVRIHYSMYDQGLPDVNYKLQVFWKFANEENALFREVQAHLFTDPEDSGITGILPGTVLHTSQHRLFPGFGAVRAFTWDAPNEPQLRRFMETVTAGVLPDRFQAIDFLIRPLVESSNPEDIKRRVAPDHQIETPRILYYYLNDRPTEVLSDQRRAEFSESFASDQHEDKLFTDAHYGPPNNINALVGLANRNVLQFGEGTAEIVLAGVPRAEWEPDAIDEYHEFNTDDMTLSYKQIADAAGTPCNPLDDQLAGNARSTLREVVFDNPGESRMEFHFATLEIPDGMKVFARGTNPLIIRLKNVPGSIREPVFKAGNGSIIDLNGCPGGDGPRAPTSPDVPGQGGLPGPGGGPGGGGAELVLDALGNTVLKPAEDGGNDGGEGGESTLGIDPDQARPNYTSKFYGAPGGGGGNRLAGRTGNTGAPLPARFTPAKAGDGGPSRGEPKLLLLSPGSGGGGGGSTIGISGAQLVLLFNAGAGGGGAGGALRIVADGGMAFEPNSSIEANGGSGGAGLKGMGDGGTNVGPGGGGSGGCILLQANGPVDVTCESLRVFGGKGGVGKDAKQNQTAGDGDGGEGWIRVESATGGVPSCFALAASTQTTKDLAKADKKVEVQSVQDFPNQGTLLILDPVTEGVLEELSYTATVAATNTFEGLTRPAPRDPAITLGATVRLRTAFEPLTDPVLSEGKVVASPESVPIGKGRDGEVHLRFQPTIDPFTGDLMTDPVTGQLISVYTFNTETSVINGPNGEFFHETSSAETEPGFLDCTRLKIDPNTILRGSGARPMRISVSGQAEIAGTINVSGFPGGILRITSETRANPQHGLGGPPGPAGGPGGDGGVNVFVNGDLRDKNPENTLPIHGSPGQAPPFVPDGLDRTPVAYGGANLEDQFLPSGTFTRATGGATLRGQGCGGQGQGFCTDSAGGAGGGGNLENGAGGNAFPVPGELAGKGGSPFGPGNLRYAGDYWLNGGTGGAGGGGNPHVSNDYVGPPGIPGSRFRSGALHAPGTGGGGGGGVLHLVAENLAILNSGKILARGGDAYQSIDLGGNGGGGAGGVVFLQIKNSLTIEQGAVIDVAGGLANQPVPILPGQALPEYPGNIRIIAGNQRELGGSGGNGAPGRIRVEGENGSLALKAGLNLSVSSGPFLVNTSLSLGVSKPVHLGVGPGNAASSPVLLLGSGSVRYFEFGQPGGTDSVVLWQGADESLDIHGAAGPFSQAAGRNALLGQRDASRLQAVEYIRFVVPFLSNGVTQEAQAIREIRLQYKLEEPFALP